MGQNCHFCGESVKVGEEFCSNCGSKLQSSSDTQTRVPQEPAQQESAAQGTMVTPDEYPDEGYLPYDEQVPPQHVQPPAPEAPPAYTAQGAARKNPGLLPLLITLGVLLGLLLIAVGIYYMGGSNTSRRNTVTIGDAGFGEESGGWFTNARERESLYSGRQYEHTVETVSSALSQGDPQAALDAALTLSANNCQDPEPYQACAYLFAEYEENDSAFRLFLLAYGVSGQKQDLELAYSAATPQEVILNEKIRLGMEILFHKPFGDVHWQEIGSIRTYRQYPEYFIMSRLDSAEATAANFEQSLYTVPFDEDAQPDSFYFLYGLRELGFYNTAVTNVHRTGIGGMRELRSLTFSSVSDSGDLSTLAGAWGIESLTVGGRNLTSLNGLDKLEALTSLTLVNTKLESLDGLQEASRLEALSLIDNKELTDVTAAAGLPLLDSFSLQGKGITDLDFLSGLSLKNLSITGTELKTVSFLFDMQSLESLTLYDNGNLISVEGLGQLENLTALTIHCRDLAGINEIGQLTELRSLSLGSPSSLQMLQPLTKLEELRICNPSFLDNLQGIEGLSRLWSLSIQSQGLKQSSFTSSISGYCYFSLRPVGSLGNLTSLELLDLNLLGDSSALAGLSGLTYLDLSGSDINAPASSLSSLKNLVTLKLNKTTFLYNVWVQSDGFMTSIDYDKSDSSAVVGGLAELSRLERLEYRKAELKDISFLPLLFSLTYVDLNDNYIEDASPLESCPALTYADLSGNPVQNKGNLDLPQQLVVIF